MHPLWSHAADPASAVRATAINLYYPFGTTLTLCCGSQACIYTNK